MKTRLLVIALASLLLSGVGSQLWAQSAGWRWVESASFTGVEEGHSIAIDTVNNWLYLAGTWDGSDLSSVYGPDFASGSGGLDGIVAKYDLDGNVLWAFPIKSSGDNIPYDISVDPFGTINVAGFFTGATEFKGTSASSTVLPNILAKDMFLAKYSPNGNLVWAVNNGFIQNTEARGVTSNFSGIYVTGVYSGSFNFKSSSTGVPVNIPTISNQGQDIFLIKYDHSGTLQWVVDAGGTGVDIGKKVAVDQSNVYVLGDYDSPNLKFWDASRPSSPQDSLANGGGRDIVLFAVNLTLGALSYEERIFTSGDDYAAGVDVRGALLIHGTLGDVGVSFPGGVIPSNSSGSQANQDVFIARHNKTNGNAQWARIINGTSPLDFATDLDLGTNGLFYISGSFAGTINMFGVPLISNGGLDAYVGCFEETMGNPVWVTQGGGSNDDQTNSVISYRNNSSRVFAAGSYTASANFFPLPPVPGPVDSNLWIGEIYPCEINIIYPDTAFCSNDTNPIPTTLAIPGGFYYEPSGSIIFASTVTGEIDIASSTPGGPYEVIYSLLAPCFTSDTVEIYILEGPDSAAAGPDVISTMLCGQDSVFLAANTPLVGTGTWSIASGAGGSFTTINDPNSLFRGQPGQIYQLIWTISNGSCPSEFDTVKIELPPATQFAVAGPDQVLCGQDSAQLAAVPVSTSADWGILSGSGGSFNNPNIPNAIFRGVPGQTYELEWRVPNGLCPDERDTLTVSFPTGPSPALAGTDQQLCGQDSFILQATPPLLGAGNWNILSGAGGSLSSASQPNATLFAVPGQTYQLEWTISLAPCPDTLDTVTLSFPLLPDTAIAGPDLIGNALCGQSSAQLSANIPNPGTGSWTILSGAGASLSSNTDPQATFSGIPGTSYTLEWAVSLAPCGSNPDTVLIEFPAIADTADAGPDQSGAALCGLSSTSLQANTPVMSMGFWTVIAGSSATVGNSNDPNSTFSGLPGQSYTLTWTVPNAACPNAEDTVQISFPISPSPSLAGPDQSGSALCGATSTPLAANSPAVGNGLWTLVSGVGGTFNNPTDPASVFNGSPGQSYALAWVISNPPCPDARDTILINFPDTPPQADAGPDIDTCGTSSILRGNNPAGTTGKWRLNSGAGVLVTPNNPTTLVSGLSLGSNSFYWTLDDGICQDSALVQVNAFKTVFADAGVDSSYCQNAAQLLADPPVTGTGSWQLTIGAGTISDPNADTTNVSGLGTGTNTFSWIVVNGPCTDTDFVDLSLIEFAANAGPDLEACQTDVVFMQADSSQQGSWAFVNGSGVVSDPQDPRAMISGLDSGLINLRWTAMEASCRDSDEVSLFISAPPSPADAGPDQEIRDLNETFLSAAPLVVGSGNWSVLSGSGSFNDLNLANTFVVGLALGTNELLWVSSNGTCLPDSDRVIINILQGEVPTGFSPNGDGQNDAFIIRSIKGQQGTELRVFNRWGNLMYSTDDYQNDWTGIGPSGQPLADDTYYILVRFNNGREYNGYLVIKR